MPPQTITKRQYLPNYTQYTSPPIIREGLIFNSLYFSVVEE